MVKILAQKKSMLSVLGLVTVASMTAYAMSRNHDETTSAPQLAQSVMSTEGSDTASAKAANVTEVSTPDPEQTPQVSAITPEDTGLIASNAPTEPVLQEIDPLNQRANANELKAATLEADYRLELGPISGCLNQMRAFACPIVSTLPVVKDLAGFISLELGISCPTT